MVVKNKIVVKISSIKSGKLGLLPIKLKLNIKHWINFFSIISFGNIFLNIFSNLFCLNWFEPVCPCFWGCNHLLFSIDLNFHLSMFLIYESMLIFVVCSKIVTESSQLIFALLKVIVNSFSTDTVVYRTQYNKVPTANLIF